MEFTKKKIAVRLLSIIRAHQHSQQCVPEYRALEPVSFKQVVTCFGAEILNQTKTVIQWMRENCRNRHTMLSIVYQWNATYASWFDCLGWSGYCRIIQTCPFRVSLILSALIRADSLCVVCTACGSGTRAMVQERERQSEREGEREHGMSGKVRAFARFRLRAATSRLHGEYIGPAIQLHAPHTISICRAVVVRMVRHNLCIVWEAKF